MGIAGRAGKIHSKMFLKAECYDPCRKVVVLPFDGSGWDGSLTRNNQSFVACACFS